MQYTRAGARRRRVLATDPSSDASHAAAPDAAPSPGTAPAGSRYVQGATSDRQPRITDLIPRRKKTLLLLAASLVAVVAGIIDLYACFHMGAFAGDRAAMAAFDLRRPGSLADWCASASMLVCGAACLLVFSVRRHRSDDYRGSYLNWVWLAGLLSLCSIWLATPLRDAAAQAALLLGGGDASQWERYCVLGALGLVVLAALRMAYEMRDSRAALSCLLLAGSGWAAASAIRVGILLPEAGHLAAIARVAALLGGQIAMLMSILCYARRICLEAEGVIAPPAAAAAESQAATAPRKSRRRTRAAASPNADSDSAANADSVGQQSGAEDEDRPAARSRTAAPRASRNASAAKTPASKPAVAEAPAAAEEGEDDDEFSHLSKSERRRLRKLKRREQRTAA